MCVRALLTKKYIFLVTFHLSHSADLFGKVKKLRGKNYAPKDLCIWRSSFFYFWSKVTCTDRKACVHLFCVIEIENNRQLNCFRFRSFSHVREKNVCVSVCFFETLEYSGLVTTSIDPNGYSFEFYFLYWEWKMNEIQIHIPISFDLCF